MGKPIKTIHALNWYYGNICSRKCPENRQKEHYDRMCEIIRGHEEYLITHKMFVKVMHEKHHVCGLMDEELRKPTRDFWKLDCMPL
ncbi:hypothetical protein KKF59_00400 [Patescibacteria group bacterium]|nr:hypothetical protein [Patescibacteria group bacterium]MBU1907577.1 hypothetical protein [Patescibacteria group bacterium]